jgi:hypothetical protein
MRIIGKRRHWMPIGGLVFVVVAGLVARLRQVCNTDRTATFTSNDEYDSATYSNTQPSITNLPGYTGWARPASTLAGCFRLTTTSSTSSSSPALSNQDWFVTVSCYRTQPQSSSSSENEPWFYLRAYGPAILTGTVERTSKNTKNNHGNSDYAYTATLHPTIPGKYTVELVLTYSNPLSPHDFPLSTHQLPPPYFEGYVLPGFPLQLMVVEPQSSSDNNDKKRNKSGASLLPDCTMEHFHVTESNQNSVRRDAAWRVTSTYQQQQHSYSYHSEDTNRTVTLRGYQWGPNSLGFQATYEHTQCQLQRTLQDVVIAAKDSSSSCTSSMMNRIILIGDSVMRLQRDWLQKQLPDVKVEFIELYGGILRCSRISGPQVKELESRKVDDDDVGENTIVLFNSGMHDIHRLCGHTWMEDRATYLTENELQVSCLDNYQRAIRELAETVRKIPAAVKIFQTTTAAWPKYGNYGIGWSPRYAQELPLDFGFVKVFNQIAVQEIESLNAASPEHRLHVVDAYWMTLSRPDNRETNQDADIGRKMSHPGYEVVQYMVQVWLEAAMSVFCARRAHERAPMFRA